MTIQERETSVKQLIEQLYAVFAKYRFAQPMAGCTHCVSDDDLAKLTTKPLRSLTWDDVGKYAHKALTTMGELGDFKRLLPRLFELFVLEPKTACAEPQITLGRIAYAERMCRPKPGVPAFSDDEREVIVQSLLAWWTLAIHSPASDSDTVKEVLETIGCALEDVTPALRRWDDSCAIEPAMHLARFVNDHAHQIYKSRQIPLTFWSDRPECKEQLRTWLASGSPRSMLEAAFHQCSDGALQQQISDALKVLEFLASSHERLSSV